MSSFSDDFRQAAEPLLVFVASAVATVAGYVVAEAILKDGERALIGFFWGGAAFALVAWTAVAVFYRPYRARGGSPLLVCIVAALLPALMLCSRFF